MLNLPYIPLLTLISTVIGFDVQSGKEGIQKAYSQYTLLSIELRDVVHAQLLDRLEQEHGIQVDIWRKAESASNASVVEADVLVAPVDKLKLTELLHEHRVHHHVKVDDMETLMIKEREETSRRRIFTSADDPDKITVNEYHKYEEIKQYLLAVSKKYSNFVTYWNIGRSSEGRDLAAVKIGYSKGPSKKVAAFIDGCIHAREWIACATLVYIINELTTNQEKYSNLLDHMDIYILPVLNPDGYEFSWSSERMWRKTRSGPRRGKKVVLANTTDPNNNVVQHELEVEADCYGADANRNFDFDFNGLGSSGLPCSDTYSGPHAFSEPEAKAVADFLEANKDQVKVYLNVHSYSEKFIYPYGNEGIRLDNKQEMESLGEQVVSAMNQVNGEQFRAGSVLEVMYPASGLAIDYAMGHAKIPYAFAIELRPQQNGLSNGFVLPSSEIIPGASECWAGIQIVLNRAIRTNGTYPRNEAANGSTYSSRSTLMLLSFCAILLLDFFSTKIFLR